MPDPNTPAAVAIPRLNFEDLAPPLAKALEPRVRRLGYLGEFFRCTGHQPEALRAFVEFTEAAKAPLDKRTIEIIALTVSCETDNAYERNQHERLCIRLGLPRSWIAQIEMLQEAGADGLTAQDRAIQQWVLAVARGQFDAAKERFAAFVNNVGPAQAVAALLVVGRYMAHSAMVKTLGLDPPVPSIFEDGFTGD
jgi:hypothetical protein